MKLFLAVIWLLLSCGCHTSGYETEGVLGVDEFILDSYTLQEESFPKGTRAYVMVEGEVFREGSIEMEGRYLALREVLARAGGVRNAGDRSGIYIFRGSCSQPRIYRVSWEHLLMLPDSSLLTAPGDIVFVEKKPLYQWKECFKDEKKSVGDRRRGIFGLPSLRKASRKRQRGDLPRQFPDRTMAKHCRYVKPSSLHLKDVRCVRAL